MENYTEGYKEKFEKYYDEFKWLYYELYENREDTFEKLCNMMYHRDRKSVV